MAASESGFDVIGFEIDEERVSWLRDGHSYVEDVADEQLQDSLARGYLPTSDSSDLSGFHVAVISVPTPLSEGLPDLGAVEAAAKIVGGHLTEGSLVVLESTTYPGTTDEIVGRILREESGLVPGRDFYLGYSPERIDPGNAEHTLRTTPKVVSGIDEASLGAVSAFYSTFVDDVVPVNSPGVAELTKLLENTFRHVNIALVNELARFAADLGVSIWEAIDAAETKPFGFMPFRPGPGVGGHCLPVDPTYLSWRVKRRLGETSRFIELANDVNDHMPAYVVSRIQALLNRHKMPINGTSILILGLAYKPNTSDARETPAQPIVDQLAALGARLTVVDPHVQPPVLDEGIAFQKELTPNHVRDADLVVLVTDHDDFDYESIERDAVLIFDGRRRFGALDIGNVEHL